MKLSLLEIVQDIMNDMDGDEVNSINDTIESQQVAQIVKTCYLEMMANRDWPHLQVCFNLNSTSDIRYPTQMVVPENIKRMDIFKYNKVREQQVLTLNGSGILIPSIADKYEEVQYLQPEDFLSIVHSRDTTATNIVPTRIGGLMLPIYNDKPPQYWTSFDDDQVWCDAYDSAVQDTLQSTYTMCFGYLNPSWSHLDSSIPDLPSEAFPALLEEAKSTAFYVLRQVANEKAEQKAIRQNRWLSRKAWRTKGGIRYPNYGRTKAFSGYERNPLLDKG